jgi:hypothetical protein
MSSTSSIWYTTVDGITEPIKTLIDSGSTRNFLDSDFADKNNLPLIPLSKPRTVIAIDGKQTAKPVTDKISLHIAVEGKRLKQRFYVMPLGDTEAILGFSWLKEANPSISWSDLSISYPQNNTIDGKASDSSPAIPNHYQEFADIFSEKLFQ